MPFSNTSKRLVFKKPAYANRMTDVETQKKPVERQENENNPYLNARREWNNHTASIVSSKQTWQVIGILSLLITLISVGGIIHIGSQSKYIPYIIEVDKLGQAQALGPMTAASTANPKVLSAIVSQFIENARMVSPDIALQRKAIFSVYAHLAPNDPATFKMNEWLNGDTGSNPFERAKKEMVNIEIMSVLPQTSTTWQIDWTEEIRDRQGIKKQSAQMRALVTVYTADHSPQIAEAQMRNNPLNIYIRDFSWSRLQ